jgi:hypothetical protein
LKDIARARHVRRRKKGAARHKTRIKEKAPPSKSKDKRQLKTCAAGRHYTMVGLNLQAFNKQSKLRAQSRPRPSAVAALWRTGRQIAALMAPSASAQHKPLAVSSRQCGNFGKRGTSVKKFE